MHVSDSQMQAYYARAEEAGRLEQGSGPVEFLRTMEVLLRALPPAPAVLADIGGGPGRYAHVLADRGYSVVHRDPVAAHVEQVRAAAHPRVDSALGDARSLDLADASVDAVLLLGPLYHLQSATDRSAVLREALRVVRPGGHVFAAAISRWAPRLDGLLVHALYEQYPHAAELVSHGERSGELLPMHEAAFCGYTHRPHELAEEISSIGLELLDLVGLEGLAFAVHDRLADPRALQVALASAREVERVPELLGLSPHLLATARRCP